MHIFYSVIVRCFAQAVCRLSFRFQVTLTTKRRRLSRKYVLYYRITGANIELRCAALTAYSALLGPKPLKAGDTVLVLGTGGVSM